MMVNQPELGEPMAAAAADLRAAISAAAALPLRCQRTVEVGVFLCELQEVRASFDALMTAATTTAEQMGVASVNGVRRIDQYVAAQTNSDPRRVRADQRLGWWLQRYPIFAEAFAAGQMTRDQIDTVRKMDNPRVRNALAESQTELAEAARTCGYDGFKKVLDYWSIHHDPDGAKPRDDIAKTGASYREHDDGSIDVNAHFDPLAASVFKTAFGIEDQKLFRQDAETENARGVRARGAHALLNLVRRGAARKDGTFPAPLISIVMSQKVAEETLERLNNPTTDPISVAYNDIDGRCELIDGTPIHPHHVLAVMGIATFRRYVLDANSRLLDVSENVRLFPKWLKHALLVAARGKCNVKGCDAPFPWLQADHIIPHSHGGPTTTDNAQILCDPDNKWKSDTPNRGTPEADAA